MRVPFLGAIPIDPAIVIGGDEGKSIAESSPTSPSAKAFTKIVERILSAHSVAWTLNQETPARTAK